MQILKDKIIWDSSDWTGGLNEQYGSTALIEGNPLQSATAFNPHRPYGIAAPGFLATDVTNVSAVTNPIVGGINKYNAGSTITKGILIQGTGGLIHELTYSTNTITNGGGTFPHTIDHSHTNEVGEDTVAYSIGATRYAFYSFRDDMDWDVGIYDYATTFDENYMSQNATGFAAFASIITAGKSAPHPMIVGSDDVLYMGDRNFIHAFDGQVTAGGTVYVAVLTLPAGYMVTSFAKTPDFLVIYAYRQDQTDTTGSVTGEATAFFWDYLALDPTYTYDLDDNFVNGGFTWKGTVGCFTAGRPSDQWLGVNSNKSSDLRLFNGSTFERLASFDGTIPIYRGVDILSDEIMWNSAGTIFSYAERSKGKGFKMNKIALASGTSSGFLKTMINSVATSGQYVSSGATTSGGLQFYNTTAFSASSNMTTIYTKVPTQEGQINRLKSIELRLWTLGAASQTLTLNINMIGGAVGQYTILSDTFFTSKYNYQYFTDVNSAPLGDFTRIGIQMSWSATVGTPPLVDTIIGHYEPINI